MIRKNFDLT